MAKTRRGGPAASARRRRAFEPVALAVAAVCVIAAVAVMALPRQPWDRRAVEDAVELAQDGRPEKLEEFVAAATRVAQTAPETIVAPRVAPETTGNPEPRRGTLEEMRPVAVAAPPPLSPAAQPVSAAGAIDAKEIPVKAVAPPIANAPEPVSAALKSGIDTGAVTLAGCLERDDDSYFLTDASGDDAPKSRSWRSGFLRKRAARVALIDANNALRLASHVGQRIETTGVLVDREMRPRSIVVRGECD